MYQQKTASDLIGQKIKSAKVLNLKKSQKTALGDGAG